MMQSADHATFEPTTLAYDAAGRQILQETANGGLTRVAPDLDPRRQGRGKLSGEIECRCVSDWS